MWRRSSHRIHSMQDRMRLTMQYTTCGTMNNGYKDAGYVASSMPLLPGPPDHFVHISLSQTSRRSTSQALQLCAITPFPSGFGGLAPFTAFDVEVGSGLGLTTRHKGSRSLWLGRREIKQVGLLHRQHRSA